MSPTAGGAPTTQAGPAVGTGAPPRAGRAGTGVDPALAAFAEEVPPRVAMVAPEARTWIFGHLGDGNLHVNVSGIDPGDHAVDDAVLGLVLDRRGSISAEHGVGTAKRTWLARQRGGAAVAAMAATKAALDPDGILNPAVLFSSPPPPTRQRDGGR